MTETLSNIMINQALTAWNDYIDESIDFLFWELINDDEEGLVDDIAEVNEEWKYYDATDRLLFINSISEGLAELFEIKAPRLLTREQAEREDISPDQKPLTADALTKAFSSGARSTIVFWDHDALANGPFSLVIKNLGFELARIIIETEIRKYHNEIMKFTKSDYSAQDHTANSEFAEHKFNTLLGLYGTKILNNEDSDLKDIDFQAANHLGEKLASMLSLMSKWNKFDNSIDLSQDLSRTLVKQMNHVVQMHWDIESPVDFRNESQTILQHFDGYIDSHSLLKSLDTVYSSWQSLMPKDAYFTQEKLYDYAEIECLKNQIQTIHEYAIETNEEEAALEDNEFVRMNMELGNILYNKALAEWQSYTSSIENLFWIIIDNQESDLSKSIFHHGAHWDHEKDEQSLNSKERFAFLDNMLEQLSISYRIRKPKLMTKEAWLSTPEGKSDTDLDCISMYNQKEHAIVLWDERILDEAGTYHANFRTCLGLIGYEFAAALISEKLKDHGGEIQKFREGDRYHYKNKEISENSFLNHEVSTFLTLTEFTDGFFDSSSDIQGLMTDIDISYSIELRERAYQILSEKFANTIDSAYMWHQANYNIDEINSELNQLTQLMTSKLKNAIETGFAYKLPEDISLQRQKLNNAFSNASCHKEVEAQIHSFYDAWESLFNEIIEHQEPALPNDGHAVIRSMVQNAHNYMQQISTMCRFINKGEALLA